jgi:hypothetical protein
MLDLIEFFDLLQQPEVSADNHVRFAANHIAIYEQYRLAKDSYGTPALLVSIESKSSIVHPSSIVIENLTVEHDVSCHISHPDGTYEKGQFTVIHCTGRDHLLHVYFLRIIGTLIVSLGKSPLQEEVNQAISKIVELFRAMTEPPRKTIQGLWAELFVIARARDPVMLVGAWHTAPGDIYDFSAGPHRIEVKSAANRIRQHHFRFEQLHPPKDTMVLVVSLFVQRAGKGTSLAELVDEIHRNISSNPDLLLHLDRIVGFTLGDSWFRALEERFDYELAKESLAFFEADSIPSVSLDIPHDVCEVHFKADLSNTPPADIVHYKAMGGLFQAALRL